LRHAHDERYNGRKRRTHEKAGGIDLRPLCLYVWRRFQLLPFAAARYQKHSSEQDKCAETQAGVTPAAGTAPRTVVKVYESDRIARNPIFFPIVDEKEFFPFGLDQLDAALSGTSSRIFNVFFVAGLAIDYDKRRGDERFVIPDFHYAEFAEVDPATVFKTLQNPVIDFVQFFI
jgi:hypothetical protein